MTFAEQVEMADMAYPEMKQERYVAQLRNLIEEKNACSFCRSYGAPCSQCLDFVDLPIAGCPCNQLGSDALDLAREKIAEWDAGKHKWQK